MPLQRAHVTDARKLESGRLARCSLLLHTIANDVYLCFCVSFEKRNLKHILTALRLICTSLIVVVSVAFYFSYLFYYRLRFKICLSDSQSN